MPNTIPGFLLEPRFKHVLIDEYQDLNPCDLAIASTIAEKGAMLLACGDDDQSIYGFRYADPTGIRGFIDQYQGSADLQLAECQRCGSAILESAIWVARQDRLRIEKALRAVEGRPPGEVHLLGFQNGAAEARGIASLCRKLIDEGTAPEQILVLVRSDRHSVFSEVLQTAFASQNVGAKVNTEKRTILDEKHGRKMLTMLQIIANAGDHLAWRSRLEVTDGIGNRTVEAIYDFARQQGIGFSGAIKRLPELIDTVPVGTRGALQRMVQHTLATVELFYQDNTDQGPESATLTSRALLEMITTIAEGEIAEDRPEVVSFIAEIIATSGATTLEDLLVAFAVGREDVEPELEQGCINILTMHQAKGLSADAVFIMAAEDEILPRSEAANDVDADRRLLYVSMTRARHRLFITYSGMRTGRQQHVGRTIDRPQRHLSRFLRNSPLNAVAGEEYVLRRTAE